MIDRYKWFYHPIFIFVLSIVALAASLFLYIYWYVEVSAGLKEVIRRYHLDSTQVLTYQTWVVILVLSILVGLILAGILLIFVYHLKTLQLYRLQYNFINNFTHELKTPVTSLQLFLETLKKHELPREEELKYLSWMIQDVDRLSDQINRILNLAKIENKSYQEEFVEVDLIEMVRSFRENNRQLFPNCQIRIFHPAMETLPYCVNRSLFEMLLNNLYTNAIKYNDSPQPVMEITFARAGKKLLISFADNGIGIARPEFKKIFRKFYQIGQADNRTARGSGLGLYLVRNIVRIHRGKIRVASEGAGRGTVFTLILPCKPKGKSGKKESREAATQPTALDK